jgi:hypothetical protein
MVKAEFRDHLPPVEDGRGHDERGSVQDPLPNICCLISSAFDLAIEARSWGKDELDAEDEAGEDDPLASLAWI